MKILIFVIILIIGIITTFLINKKEETKKIIMGIIATLSLGIAGSFAYSGIVSWIENKEQAQEVSLNSNLNNENEDDNNNLNNVSSSQNMKELNNSVGTQESVDSLDYIEDVSSKESFTGSISVNDDIDITTTDAESIVASEIDESGDLEELEPVSVSLSDVAWLENKKIHNNMSAATMRGEQWSDCIGFGNSNINSDGQAVLIAACDQKYSKFIAEIAPQEGFDKSEKVTLCIYGACDGEQISKEEFSIDFMTESFKVEIDISGAKELYIWKFGNYNQGRIAGQYINGNSGMGVLMRDATLCR